MKSCRHFRQICLRAAAAEKKYQTCLPNYANTAFGNYKRISRKVLSFFSSICWFGGVVVQQQAVAAAIPNIRIFSRPISQRIQFSKYHLHTTLAAAKVISTFPVSCFSDDKIVDNAFVFSGPFYFNCPIGHVIQKLDMFVHKI